VSGKPRRLTEGSVLVIPPNVPHAARALRSCRVLDVFSPVREDYRDPNAPSILQAASRS
jgi:quercetin dioxygenase-like cupin family protein